MKLNFRCLLILFFGLLLVFFVKEGITNNRIIGEVEMDINLQMIKETDLLVLVNSDNKIPDDYQPNLIEFKNHYVSKFMEKDLKRMFYVASKSGVELVINNSYRSGYEQKKIFDDRVNKLRDEGVSYTDAFNEVKRFVNLPGYSEHETGLAIDFSCGNFDENAKMWIWLRENAYKYGFILRYPKEKEEITKINYEAWHYRYVGKDVARYMHHNNLCLEEFLNK